MSVIEVNHFTKDYGFGRGVFDASFKVEKGEVFGFLGPNGAGKSTTIRHLMGFSKPQSGETKILGMDTFENYYKFLNKVGYIPGEIALPAGLTGWEFLRMMQSMQGIKNEEQLNKMLNLFELEDNVLKGETKRMSLGVKRKLAIVASFMSDPEVLILD
ncbi:MAG TPA: ABC transporter ATP-binding protein, partial [Clostridiales bacterium]|nr:ABC transporter ATP-binding protein [Clostridiales bacterium]